ncbi:hypothetical protein SCHPADRAFT_892612 [Schizopora paradoxa]|uniref:Uncharacterized protein n=1 Tax=Schizopora paradoxa TaxID=27342 RepID=A0A0H2REV2_9AGAM|nr:hypothetical protein SCHPADRAFT_892612 [Schizopora paradoxa]
MDEDGEKSDTRHDELDLFYPSNLPNQQYLHQSAISTSTPFDSNSIEHDSSDSSTVHSYFSTWSTNYTMSNLPGPGRIVGNIISRAGSSLERGLGKVAHRASVGKNSRAISNLQQLCPWYFDEYMTQVQKEKVCDMLLGYARSSDLEVQFTAFNQIAFHAILSPSIRILFDARCQEPIDTVIDSWVRPGINYGAAGLYIFELSARCLSTLSNPVMDELTQYKRENGPQQLRVDFSRFEKIFCCCRDMTDTTIALKFVMWNWNGFDLFIRRKGFRNSVLLKIATAIRTRYEIASCGVDFSQSQLLSFDGDFLWPVLDFLSGMWSALRALSMEETKFLCEDEAQLALWAEVFKLHCILQSRIGRTMSPQASNLFCKTWREEGEDQVPGVEYRALREALLMVELANGDAIRKRFPPCPMDAM